VPVDPYLQVLGLYFDPPMAVARVGAAAEPVDAYRWVVAENAHRGVETQVVPAPSLRAVPCRSRPSDGGGTAYRLEVHHPETVRFKDHAGRVRPVAPFFALWARVQDGRTGALTSPDASVTAVANA